MEIYNKRHWNKCYSYQLPCYKKQKRCDIRRENGERYGYNAETSIKELKKLEIFYDEE